MIVVCIPQQPLYLKHSTKFHMSHYCCCRQSCSTCRLKIMPVCESRAVCQRTTQHVPFITLRLCEDSSTDQLQQWRQATQQFQHVTSIHIQVASRLTAVIFDQAMQLLSQRKQNVTQLHLLTAGRNSSYNSSGYACISTLLPVQHVIQHLDTLILQGIAFENLAVDLQQLTAASSSWQLQS